MHRTVTAHSGTVTNIAFGGDGVIRHEGKVVFVPFVLPGERVEFDIIQDKKSHAFGQLLNILEPNADRVTPKCEYYGRCGGCQLQHASYDLQLKIKRQFVKEALTRIGKLTTDVESVIGTDHQWAYRRRIRLHQQGKQVGFIGIDGHSFVPVTHCEIFSGKNLEMDPDIFVQAHPEQSERLYADLEKAICGLGEALKILDLYCGTGTLTVRLAQQGFGVTGVELNAKAIAHAQAHHQEPIDWINADVSKVIKNLLRERPDIVLVNPPRTGLHPDVCKALIARPPKHIFYTSCMPATLARDLKILVEAGYEITHCQPYDLFPQTTHVETVVSLCWNRHD